MNNVDNQSAEVNHITSNVSKVSFAYGTVECSVKQ